MIAFNVPQVGVNDEFVTLMKIFTEDLKEVNKGDLVCIIESSKATMDVEAPESGYIKLNAKTGDQVKINSILFYILKNPEELVSIVDQPLENSEQVNATRKAIELAKNHGIDLTTFSNKTIIREKDIQKLIEKRNGEINIKSGIDDQRWLSKLGTGFSEIRELNKSQKLIAGNLSQVHQSVVTSYFSMIIESTPLQKIIDQFKENNKIILTHTEIVIYCISRLLTKYPLLNSFLLDESVRFYEETNIGFTIDINDRLIVPVIRNCNQKTLVEIARDANIFKMKAIMNKVIPADLMGGSFTVSNLIDGNLLIFLPVINIYQSAVIGISGNFSLPTGDASNQLIITLGIDHRIINGKYAANFIRDLKAQLMSVFVDIV